MRKRFSLVGTAEGKLTKHVLDVVWLDTVVRFASTKIGKIIINYVLRTRRVRYVLRRRAQQLRSFQH